MADTVFRGAFPPVKAIDNGDGTYSVGLAIFNDTGVYEVIQTVNPPLRVVKLADNTYAIAAVAV